MNMQILIFDKITYKFMKVTTENKYWNIITHHWWQTNMQVQIYFPFFQKAQ